MTRKLPPLGAHIGLLVAIVALLPGLLALLAAGVGGDPMSSSLCITQAAGACSVAALQGLDRRLTDAPLALPVPPLVWTGAPSSSIDDDVVPAAGTLLSPTASRMPLRL